MSGAGNSSSIEPIAIDPLWPQTGGKPVTGFCVNQPSRHRRVDVGHPAFAQRAARLYLAARSLRGQPRGRAACAIGDLPDGTGSRSLAFVCRADGEDGGLHKGHPAIAPLRATIDEDDEAAADGLEAGRGGGLEGYPFQGRRPTKVAQRGEFLRQDGDGAG